MAEMLLGWALAEEGQEEEGIAQMRQGLADLLDNRRRTLAAVVRCPAGQGAQQGGGSQRRSACWTRLSR